MRSCEDSWLASFMYLKYNLGDGGCQVAHLVLLNLKQFRSNATSIHHPIQCKKIFQDALIEFSQSDLFEMVSSTVIFYIGTRRHIITDETNLEKCGIAIAKKHGWHSNFHRDVQG